MREFVMTEHLKRIQGMAQRYNQLAVIKDETLAAINAAVEARNIAEARLIIRSSIKAVRNAEY